MYYFIDLCCGFGAMRKGFEKTGNFACVLSADIDMNMRNLYQTLYHEQPLGDITSKEVRKVIKDTTFDVLTAGIVNLNENVFFELLDIIEENQPKAFVLEMSMNTIDYSFCKMLEDFCNKQQYHFVGYEKGVDNIVLDLQDFGVPESCQRIYCVCIKKGWSKCGDDPIVMQLNKKHDFKCYEYDKYNPDVNPEQRRGIDWGFNFFKFLKGTPDERKENIVNECTPIPVASSIALDLNFWLKK